MLLSGMEVSNWRQVLTETGKAQARLGDTTITVSEGYRGRHPGGHTETFVVGPVALVMQKHSTPTYYERETYTKIDEKMRDSIAKDILFILKRKEGIALQDIDLEFQPMPNHLP